MTVNQYKKEEKTPKLNVYIFKFELPQTLDIHTKENMGSI